MNYVVKHLHDKIYVCVWGRDNVITVDDTVLTHILNNDLTRTFCVCDVVKVNERTIAVVVRGMGMIKNVNKLDALVVRYEFPNTPEYAKLVHNLRFDDKYLERILNPIPQGILQIAAVLESCGDCWKDDCGERHVDDINPIEVAKKLWEAMENHKINFITKELIKYEEEGIQVSC